MKEKAIPLSSVYVGDSRASSTEQQWLRSSGSHEITSVEQLQELVQAVCDTHAHYQRVIQPLMSRERAERIRELRCEKKQSYRMLAGTLHLEWGADSCWHPITNQIAGVVLCELAAVMLGENADRFPWKDVA